MRHQLSKKKKPNESEGKMEKGKKTGIGEKWEDRRSGPNEEGGINKRNLKAERIRGTSKEK